MKFSSLWWKYLNNFSNSRQWNSKCKLFDFEVIPLNELECARWEWQKHTKNFIQHQFDVRYNRIFGIFQSIYSRECQAFKERKVNKLLRMEIELRRWGKRVTKLWNIFSGEINIFPSGSWAIKKTVDNDERRRKNCFQKKFHSALFKIQVFAQWVSQSLNVDATTKRARNKTHKKN